MTWVGRLAEPCPERYARVETARIDTQLMEDAETSGERYPAGRPAGLAAQELCVPPRRQSLCILRAQGRGAV